MNNFSTWFKKFLEEKNLAYKEFQIDHWGMTHYINTDVVIEAIYMAPATEQTAIRKMLVNIDYKNGDVLHYFEHLARGLVVNS